MRLHLLRSWLLVACAAGVLTTGCGGQGSTLYSPVGPTGADSLTALESGDLSATAALGSAADETVSIGYGDKGKGHETDKDRGKGGRGPSGSGPDDDLDDDAGEDDADQDDADEGDDDRSGRGHSDKVVGFVTATGIDTLTVRGITVTATDTTRIHHGHRLLTLADVHVGDHVQAYGSRTGTTLVAIEIKVQDTGNDNDDDDGIDGSGVEVKGTVSGLGTQPNAGCTAIPAGLTFSVGTTTVKTNASTVFDDVTCASLANGNIVEVEGTTQADGSVLAGKVELEGGADDVEGTISSVDETTTCPTRGFNIGTTTVTTTSATTYIGSGGAAAACGDLAVGRAVQAEGTKQADGSITAASIEFE